MSRYANIPHKSEWCKGTAENSVAQRWVQNGISATFVQDSQGIAERGCALGGVAAAARHVKIEQCKDLFASQAAARRRRSFLKDRVK